MSETVLHTLFVSSAVSAAFFGMYAMLGALGEVLERILYLRTPAWKRFHANSRTRRRSEGFRGPASLGNLALGAGVGGVIALLFALWGTDYAYLAVFGIAAAYIPSFVRRQMKANAHWRLRLEVRDFVAELRLALALNVTVSQALEHLAQRARENPTPFAERIAHHVERTLRMEGPEKMLQVLAEEFDSEDPAETPGAPAGRLARRPVARRSAGESADSIAQNILASAELSVEEMPTRLILPMLVALFPTIMVLALIPAVSLLMTSLTGVPTP